MMLKLVVAVLASFALHSAAAPLHSETRVLLHRVVRQFNPRQFLKPSFSVSGGLSQMAQGQQQAQAPGSQPDHHDTINTTTPAGTPQPRHQPDHHDTINTDTNIPAGTPEARHQPQSGPMAMFGGQNGGNSQSSFNLFQPAQFFMSNQRQPMFNTFSSSPYLAVGLAPFSKLISPNQFTNPRNRLDAHTQGSSEGESPGKQNFTGNASGDADPQGPVGLTGDSGNGHIFQPPGFFVNPGTSV